MPNTPIPHDSIDALIASRLPAWLKGTSEDRLIAFQRALRRQQGSTAKVAGLLDDLPSLENFAAPLLVQGLRAAGVGAVDVQRSQVCIARDVELPTAAPNLPAPRHTFHSSQSLLSAALHNYHKDETSPSIFRRAYLIDARGNTLALSFEAFAGLCRRLDIGGQYQRLLQERFVTASDPGAGARRVEQALEENLGAQFEVAMRMAALNKALDEHSYLQLLPLMAPNPVVPAVSGLVTARQLYLLGKPLQGVVTLELANAGGGAPDAVILWLPGDSQQPVSRHTSWNALYRALGRRLRGSAFRAWFGRCIAVRDHPAFFAALKAIDLHKVPELDGRHLPIAGGLFAHLRAQRLNTLLDDARVLAVPTGDEDEADRHARLQASLAAGLDLLALASSFVPLLGEVMLVVTAVQIGEQLYEGYQAWQLGDRQAALDHLFEVAQSLAVGVVVGKLSGEALRLTRRVPFVDELTPLHAEGGALKLAHAEPQDYQVHDQDTALGHQAFVEGGWRLRLPEGTYRVARQPATETWHIHHPWRHTAQSLRLEHNGSGGWRHELERPQQWVGEGLLLRRLDRRLAGISDETAQHLLLSTGFDGAQLRRLHLESAPVPARLLDAYERHALHQQFPALRGEAFEGYLRERQVVAGPAAAVLLRDFPGLSVRAAEALVGDLASTQREGMVTDARVPLSLAERARWHLRDSRLDRACAALRMAQAVNADTEQLALALLARLAPWPESVRVELREANASGLLLAQQGSPHASEVHCIVRERVGYRVQQTAGEPLGSGVVSLPQALLSCLDDAQIAHLGGGRLDEHGLAERLASQASVDREQAATLIGLMPIGRGLRPPHRFAEGRLGYPLSGRGESSRQAIRRGIHQIFPSLSNLQLEAYVLELMNRGVSLWDHYSELQQQLGTLRQALRNWRDGARGPLDLLRRQRVIDTIRRSWRRKVTNHGGDFVLEIDGERVGSLPALPAGLDFGHVRRLALRNMDLAVVDDDFLGRFANLVELDLRGNRLNAIPPGVERMTQLRQLHLAGNQIVLDHAGDARLAPLTRLHTLDLSGNPLGQAPTVAGLRHLRWLLLRSTGLEAVPDPVRRLSWRGMNDLRSNSIRHLRQELHSLRLNLQRMSLHDNPLDEASEQALHQASTAVPRRGAHAVADDALRELWLGQQRGELRARHQALWDNLQADAGAEDLFRFLGDFAQSDDFTEYPEHYQSRVWHMLEACEQHEPLRLALFAEAGGPRTCEDRLLLTLSQLELAVLVEQTTFEGPTAQVERRLVRLGRALFRLDEVDGFAIRHIQALGQREIALIDEIEIRLFFRIRLSRALRLPEQPADMHYESFASVTTSDLKRAQAAVLGAENTEVLIASLAQRPFWQHYVRQRYAERFEALAEPFHLRLDALEQVVDETGEQHYLEQCNALMGELEAAERELNLTLAREAHERASD